jgi:hypothetical protein
MAKATSRIIPPAPTAARTEITLILSQEEAETLKGIAERIGGPIEGRRRHLLDIGGALYNAGIRSGIDDNEVEPERRSIYFRSKEDSR